MFKWEEFLEQKGAEYAPFDPTRAPRLLKELGLSLEGKIVLQVIGTNGKGSTGRFLALMLKALGMKVGHFTSPHLLHVCERFWINGECVRDSVLEEAFLHLDVEVLKAASYFELLTFLAFRVFQTCDVVILEAGLGGEYDSTTTCSTPMMTLFTSIGIDHQDLLGVKLAYAYTTRHPEYNVDSQIRNLKEMIAGNKISYIISWLRKGNIMGIEGFLTLDTTTQRMLLDKVVCEKEEEIKKIFNERFKCK